MWNLLQVAIEAGNILNVDANSVSHHQDEDISSCVHLIFITEQFLAELPFSAITEGSRKTSKQFGNALAEAVAEFVFWWWGTADDSEDER